MKPKATVAAGKNVKRQFQESWLFRFCLSASTLEHLKRLSGEGPHMEEYDPAKDLEAWFSRERKILNIKYQNWPIEEDIEFEESD